MYGIKYLFTSIAAACVLAACGGGGGGGGGSMDSDSSLGSGAGGGGTAQPAGSPLQGVWTGTATSVEGSRPLTWDTTAIALADGRLYFVSSEFYDSSTAPERNRIGAFVAGQGTAENGNYSLSNGQEFGFEADWLQRAASINGTYASQQSFQGRISYGEGAAPRDFNSSYASSYEGAASLEDLRPIYNNPDRQAIQGTFLAPDPAGGSDRYPVTLQVGADGSLTSRFASECNVTGTLVPSQTLRVFNATIQFNSDNCPYAPGTTLSGVAFLKNSVSTADAPTVQNRFHLVASNGNQGVAFAQLLSSQ